MRWETNEKLCMSYTLLRKKRQLNKGEGSFSRLGGLTLGRLSDEVEI